MNGAARMRWSSRKFWTMMFWQTAMTALMVLDKLPVSTFEALSYLILGGYFLSNVAGKVMQDKYVKR